MLNFLVIVIVFLLRSFARPCLTFRFWKVVVQEALKEKKIEPKENVAVLRRLMIAVEKLSKEVDHNLELLDTLEQNKADKLDLQVQHH